MKRLRQITGITALALWMLAIVPKIVLENSQRLVWQMDNWAAMFAPIITIAYAIILTIGLVKNRRAIIKVLGALCCVAVVLFCSFLFFVAGVFLNHKVWSNNDYVVYDEYGGFIDPTLYVLYKRDGLFDNRLYILESFTYQKKNIDYTIYENLNLIKEDAEVSPFEGDNFEHTTTFFRLSDGEQYDQSKNDSLYALIKNRHRKFTDNDYSICVFDYYPDHLQALKIITKKGDAIMLDETSFESVSTSVTGRIEYTYHILRPAAAERLKGLLSTDIAIIISYPLYDDVPVEDPFEYNGKDPCEYSVDMYHGDYHRLYVGPSRNIVNRTKEGKPCIITVHHV